MIGVLLDTTALGHASGADRDAVRDALRAITHAERELAAAKAQFVTRLVELDHRGAKPALVQTTGASAREAADALITANVIRSVRGAAELLAAGHVSAAHLRALHEFVRRTPDPAKREALCDEAAELLPHACVQSVDEFTRTVRDYLVKQHAKTVRERQRAARGLWTGTADHDNARINMILTPAEALELQKMIDDEVDAMYRAQFPERAASLGGHEVAPLHQRRLDAFMNLLRGKKTSSGRPTAVLLIEESTLKTQLAGHGSIPLDDVPGFIRRADLLFAVVDAHGAVLKFGRSRRFASEAQKLALMIERGARCATPGCDAPWWRLRAHHRKRSVDDGETNLDNLELLCDACHAHHHQTNDPPKHQEARNDAIANRAITKRRAKRRGPPASAKSTSTQSTPAQSTPAQSTPARSTSD